MINFDNIFVRKIIIILIVLGLIIIVYYFLKPNNIKIEKKETMTPIFQQTKNKLPKKLILTSPVFEHMGKIPVKYTCDGQKINPPLEIFGVDDNAKSLVLIMEDPDVPKNIRADGMWDHWLKFNLPANLKEIKEGIDPGGISGLGTSKTLKYVGPCPPDKEHRYLFRLFSLDIILDLKEGAMKFQIEEAMKNHILQEVVLIGVYERE
ncbi:MAG: YbhB/YbcL family Raf kinase inhibitor-like protein [bacterium]